MLPMVVSSSSVLMRKIIKQVVKTHGFVLLWGLASGGQKGLESKVCLF
jgi:hypothetical protein